MVDFREMIRARLSQAGLSAGDERSAVEEMNAHLQDLHADLRARGMSEHEALQAVEREMTTQIPLSEAMRGLKTRASSIEPPGAPAPGGVFRQLIADIRYGLRTFIIAPAFAFSAVVALGIGTGASTAVFSLLRGVVLRPLPYAQPEQLVTLWETNVAGGLRKQPVSPVSFMDYRAASGTFSDAAAWWKPETGLTDDRGDPLRVATVETSENLFSVLGVKAAVGRGFEEDSTLYGKEAEAVISDRLWRQRFNADAHVVGRAIKLNGYPTTIVGVMPPGFHFPDETDVWSRLSWDLRLHNRGARFMGAVARLQPGVTAEQANLRVAAVGGRIARESPATNEGWSAEVMPLRDDIAGVYKPGLIALFGASALLLLIACMNVANLLLARASSRQTEMAVRSALGASRVRLVRQLMTECLVLASAGAMIGFITATVAVRAMLAWSPVAIPRSADIAMDPVVFLFAVITAAVTTLAFGLYPALSGSRANLQGVLRQAGRAGTTSMGAQSRGILVVLEVALSVALLSGAGLLLHTVSSLLHEKSGVARTDAIAADIQLPDAQYQDFASAARFYDELTTALRRNPLVTSAAVSNFLPLEPGWRIPFERAQDPPSRPGSETLVQYHTVDGEYFDALGVPVIAGRSFTNRDRVDTKPVVIINEAMARKYWPNQNPIGQTVRAMGRQIGPLGARLIKQDEHEIVGVVADIRNVNLTEPAEPALYSALGQFPFRRMYVVVRGKGTAAQMTDLLRTETRRLDPALPLGDVQTMAHILSKATDSPRFLMAIMLAFSAIAILLAGLGVYGLLAYMVMERKREFGIRMALGADRGRILRLVLHQGVILGVAGALGGVLIALLADRALQSLLFGVQPHDPATLLTAAALVTAIAVGAALAPALRATRVQPMRTLRE